MRYKVLFVGLIGLLGSCASLKPYDAGVYNPKQEAADQTALVTLDSTVKVSQVDGDKVNWSYASGGRVDIVVRLTPGVHTFAATFSDGQRYTFFPQTFLAQVQAGGEYRVVAVIEGAKVRFDVIDAKTKASVVLDLARLNGEKKDVISTFIKNVLNPTMDEVKHTVRLENDQLIIDLAPDMAYVQTTKATGAKVTGRHGFEMDFSMTKATLFLLPTALEAMGRQEFLDHSDYTNTAPFAWVPVECTATSVTFRVVRPAADEGKLVQFSVHELTSNP